MIRTAGKPMATAPVLRAVTREIAPDAALYQVVPLAELISSSVQQPRFAATVVGVFALLATALASTGLFGVLSYLVSQRRHELGVRAALGASRTALIALVVGHGMKATLAGVALGLVAAALVTRVMESMLFGVRPLDAVSFAAAAALLVAIAFIACVVPALRAATTDPARVLRMD